MKCNLLIYPFDIPMTSAGARMNITVITNTISATLAS